jgi:hypothetical protein
MTWNEDDGISYLSFKQFQTRKQETEIPIQLGIEPDFARKDGASFFDFSVCE